MDPVCLSQGESNIPLWLGDGGFIALFIALIFSFVGLAIVVEEYFVPALNILCDDMKLPDDIAGATIMAIGNSSPELFSCLISLFVTHTALGVGTAIGSAIFNHLCICAGSIFYADKYTLPLNWRILCRESVFYLSSTVILVWSLKGNDFISGFQNAFNGIGSPPTQCLVVHWYQAVVLFAGYVLYIITCSLFGPIVRCCCPLPTLDDDEEDEVVAEECDPAEASELNSAEGKVLAPSDNIELPRRRTSFFGSSSNLNSSGGKVSLMVHSSTQGVSVPGSAVPLPSEIIEVPRHRSSFFGSSVNLYHRQGLPQDQTHLVLSSTNHSTRSADCDDNLENGTAGSTEGNDHARTRARTRTRSDDDGNGVILASRANSSFFVSPAFPQVESSQIRAAVISEANSNSATKPRKMSVSSAASEMSAIVEAETEKDLESSISGGAGGGDHHHTSSTLIHSHGDRAEALGGGVGGIQMGYSPRRDNFGDYNIREILPSSEPMPFPEFEGWMYKRSRFYSRHRILSNQKWELRFFIFDQFGLRYSLQDPHAATKPSALRLSSSSSLSSSPVPSPIPAPIPQKTILSIFDITDVSITDPHLFEFVIRCSQKLSYRFRCLNYHDLHAVVNSLQQHINHLATLSEMERKELAKQILETKKKATAAAGEDEDETHHNVLSTPEALPSRYFHYFLYPMKWCIYHSIPEIVPSGEREENSKSYWWTINISILWLAALSYLMNYSLEEFGLLFHISSGALGLTFGASGTSVPNLLSSMIVARQGLGDMAVSNAFGSNIFCIYFVLGFSWTLYIFVHGGQPYDLLPDDGLVLLVIFLLATMLVFTVILLVNRFVLTLWMGIVFVVAYTGFVGFAFALN